MDSSAFLLFVLVVSTGMLRQVRSLETVIGLYGETIVVPCMRDETAPGDKLMFTKWKYEKDDGTAGYLMLKQAHKDEAIVQATDSYATRVDMADNSSLLISQGTLQDQRIYTCMVVSESNLREYPVTVVVYKKPASPEIMDKAKMLEKDKLTTLGTCVSKDANPAAEITWQKNGKPLVADGKATIVSSAAKVDPATGLTTTTSSLQYTATKEDLGARFSCLAAHMLGPVESPPQTIPVHYPTEKVSLTVHPKGPIAEGGNVTLKCHADGNPPPSSYNFHIKGQTVLVENSDSYTLTAVTRDSAGEYKCSLVDNEKMEASQSIAVSYLDMSLSPTGKVLKKVKDPLVVKMIKNASGDAKVTWTKNGEKTEAPVFGKLTYAHAGMYVCEVSMGGLTRRQSFELVVEGTPVITGLNKNRADDNQHKVLTCEAEAVPEPVFSWNVNGTNEESSYNEKNGKATNKITVVPRANLTVTCSVSNKLGDDAKTINVSSLFKDEPPKKREGSSDDSGDQAKLIVGIVVGLIIAAAVVALVYWLYMKRRQGTWKTGEKETGTSEESKKLEENNHTV